MKQILFDFGTIGPFGLRVYGYGLMLVLGFLLAIFAAQWRARRAGENAEIFAHVGLLSVLGGIVGARAAYVIQHWSAQFAARPAEILDVTSGGLIYYGGLILGIAVVTLYLRYKEVPVRRYLDIVAVSVMVGLAFGRTGCLLNGCCYGGETRPGAALSMTFPMYSRPLLKLDGSPGPFSQSTEHPSPVYAHQYFDLGKIAPDARLTYPVRPPRLKEIYGKIDVRLLLPRDFHGPLTNNQVEVMFGTKEQAKEKFRALAPGGYLTAAVWQKGLSEHGEGFLRGSEIWQEAIAYDHDGDGQLSFDEAWFYLQARKDRLTEEIARFDAGRMDRYLQADLYALAEAQRSLPVAPIQAIGIANALVLAVVLALFYRLRWREGQVFALLLILYPVTRFVEELIRDDNAHDWTQGVFTHNQYTSLILFAIGIGIWLWLRWQRASAGPAWAARLSPEGSTSGPQMPKKNHQVAQKGQRSFE